ncbi:TonB-dependent receptor [Sphingomonas oleivorans]|uniref:TonB-dependent receptor n=1 Tax=Sphingomonas oleivorans TaxID=1735121 RepID=A0A2T5G2I7_9SPHN|nr:TonB-dependent receptor [Sphingomonas oleivorans]PTQ13311.1 TonB-dependent receptor [Sphingomonas oleivorans]
MMFAALLAQATATSALAPAAAEGVTRYGPGFFAVFQPSTAKDLVAHLPGFTLDMGDAVRGFEGAAGNVLIDGARPAAKSDGLDAILSRIPAGQVDYVEVIRGGVPGVDMQGKTILANVVRKKAGAAAGLVQLSGRYVGDYGRTMPGFRLEGTGAAAGGRWELGLRSEGAPDSSVGPAVYEQTDPLGRLLARSDIKSHADYRMNTATGAFEHGLFGGTLKINGRLYREDYRFNETSRFISPGPRDLASEDRRARDKSELGLRFDRAISARTSVEVVGLHQTEDRNLRSAATMPPGDFDYRQAVSTTETIGRVVGRFRVSLALSLEAGGEVARNRLDSDTSLALKGSPQFLPAPQVRVEEARSEAFAKAVWRPKPAWTLEAGLRQEGSKIMGRSRDRLVNVERSLRYPKPRLLVVWQARSDLQLRARGERAVGQLNFDDFVSSAALNDGVLRAGNINLVPEQAWVAELQVEQRFWGSGAAVLTARHSALSDTIDRAPIYDPTGVFDAPANIGKGSKDEVELSLSIPLSRLGLSNAEYRGLLKVRRSEVTDPTTHAKRPISGLRPLEWESHFSKQVPAWNLELGADLFGGWRRTSYRFDEVSTSKLGTYVITYGQWKPQADLVLRLEVENVTSRGFRATRRIYGGPRDVADLSLVQDRAAQVKPIVNLIVRKSFGG